MIAHERASLGFLDAVTKRLLVRDYHTKAPVPGVKIDFYDANQKPIGQATTDEKGEVQAALALLEWQSFTAVLTKEGYPQKKWTGVTHPGMDVSTIDLWREEKGDLTILLIAGGVLLLGAGLYFFVFKR